MDKSLRIALFALGFYLDKYVGSLSHVLLIHEISQIFFMLFYIHKYFLFTFLENTLDIKVNKYLDFCLKLITTIILLFHIWTQVISIIFMKYLVFDELLHKFFYHDKTLWASIYPASDPRK